MLEHDDQRIDAAIGNEAIARKRQDFQRPIMHGQDIRQYVHAAITNLIAIEHEMCQRSICVEHIRQVLHALISDMIRAQVKFFEATSI